MVDGGNFVVFFSGVGSGNPLVLATKLDVTAYGGDGDAIAILPGGDEAVISADSNQLVTVTGIASGNPVLTDVIPLTDFVDGLTISDDGTVLLARGGSTVLAIAISPIAPRAGNIGGTATHAYTTVRRFDVAGSAGLGDGRLGMAISPLDSSRGVVASVSGVAPSPTVSSIQLITGLPGTVATPPVLHAPVIMSASVSLPYAAAITPDGTRAIVGADVGLLMFTGVDTGTLVQSGPPYNAGFAPASPGSFTNPGGVFTLGITLDGAFVVALSPIPDFNNGTLFTIPILPAGFGATVGKLTGLAIPVNDQVLLH
jgi:hypothetical protein